jgi:hypothetical protein
MTEPVSASNPWLERHFREAHRKLKQLWEAGSHDDFNRMCLSPGELQSFSTSLRELVHGLPPQGELSIGEADRRPLEIQALELSLQMIVESLEEELYQRKEEPEYAAHCIEFCRARGIEE